MDYGLSADETVAYSERLVVSTVGPSRSASPVESSSSIFEIDYFEDEVRLKEKIPSLFPLHKKFYYYTEQIKDGMIDTTIIRFTAKEVAQEVRELLKKLRYVNPDFLNHYRRKIVEWAISIAEPSKTNQMRGIIERFLSDLDYPLDELLALKIHSMLNPLYFRELKGLDLRIEDVHGKYRPYDGAFWRRHDFQEVLDRTSMDGGMYENPYIYFAEHKQISILMQELYEHINSSDVHILHKATEIFYTQLTQIHPFHDGNKKIVTLVVSLLLLRAGIPIKLDYQHFSDRSKHFEVLYKKVAFQKSGPFPVLFALARELERTLRRRPLTKTWQIIPSLVKDAPMSSPNLNIGLISSTPMTDSCSSPSMNNNSAASPLDSNSLYAKCSTLNTKEGRVSSPVGAKQSSIVSYLSLVGPWASQIIGVLERVGFGDLEIWSGVYRKVYIQVAKFLNRNPRRDIKNLNTEEPSLLINIYKYPVAQPESFFNFAGLELNVESICFLIKFNFHLCLLKIISSNNNHDSIKFFVDNLKCLSSEDLSGDKTTLKTRQCFVIVNNSIFYLLFRKSSLGYSKVSMFGIKESHKAKYNIILIICQVVTGAASPLDFVFRPSSLVPRWEMSLIPNSFRKHDTSASPISGERRVPVSSDYLRRVVKNPNRIVIIDGIEIPEILTFSLGDNILSGLSVFLKNQRAKEVLFSQGAKKAALKDIRWMIEQLRKKGYAKLGLFLSDYIAQKEGEDILEAIDFPKGKVIIDLGGATGGLMSALVRKFKEEGLIEQNYRYLVIDNDEYAINWGIRLRKEGGLKEVEFICRDAVDTKLPFEFADVLISKQLLSALHESSNHTVIFNHFLEANRILKEGGEFYLIDDLGTTILTKLYLPAFGFKLIKEIKAKGVFCFGAYTILSFRKIAIPKVEEVTYLSSKKSRFIDKSRKILSMSIDALDKLSIPTAKLHSWLSKLGLLVDTAEEVNKIKKIYYNGELVILKEGRLIKINNKAGSPISQLTAASPLLSFASSPVRQLASLDMAACPERVLRLTLRTSRRAASPIITSSRFSPSTRGSRMLSSVEASDSRTTTSPVGKVFSRSGLEIY